MQEETSEKDESVAVDGVDVLENETERDPLNGDLHKNRPCQSDPPP